MKKIQKFSKSILGKRIFLAKMIARHKLTCNISVIPSEEHFLLPVCTLMLRYVFYGDMISALACDTCEYLAARQKKRVCLCVVRNLATHRHGKFAK